MKHITETLKESLLNEGFKPEEKVMIDTLTNPQWKQFAKAIQKHLGSDLMDEDDVLYALKALAGMNYQITINDFHMMTKDKTDWLALDAYDTTMVFDADGHEWIDAKKI